MGSLEEEKLNQIVEEMTGLRLKEIKKHADAAFDPEKLSGHNVSIKDVNILDLCKDLRGRKKETYRALMFDDDLNYLGYCQKDGAPASISMKVTKDVINDVISNHQTCRNIITVHNHPLVACAIPSANDGLSALAERIHLKRSRIEMIDDCIISELDFWSRKQQEHSNPDISTAVFSFELNEDSITKLKGVNRNIDLYLKLKKAGINFDLLLN